MDRLSDKAVISYTILPGIKEFKSQYPLTPEIEENIYQNRIEIENILSGKSDKFLIITEPCSINDEDASKEYVDKLSSLEYKKIKIVMRTYFEKPRTNLGWTGFLIDPDLDESYDVLKGISKAREILLYASDKNIPTATEWIQTISPQYIGDLFSYATIGARTSESQLYRQLASGLSYPVGIKNGTDGNIEQAINGIIKARNAGAFMGIHPEGPSLIKTAGNPYAHIILRGGEEPNYDSESIGKVLSSLRKNKLPESIIVDCSHGNSGKNHKNQSKVFESVLNQRDDNKSIKGVMLESYINEGNQKPGGTSYGVSITDACISFEETEELIKYADKIL